MTTITAHRRRRDRNRRRSAAFTLVEILVGLTLTTIVMTAVFSAWGLVAKSALSMGHYTEMNSVGRTGLEIFARDIRRARDIEENFSSTGMSLEMADDNDVRTWVHYYHDAANDALVREDEKTGKKTRVFKNIEWMEFTYFQTQRDPLTDTQILAENSLETRLIQLELSMTREVQGRATTKKIVSARYIMRNKQFGQ